MTRPRRFAAVLAGLLLAAVAAVAVFGVSIDLSRWRGTAEQRASAVLGRPVLLQGAFELSLGRELGLRIGGLHILDAPGSAAQDLLSIGEARARIGVFDALRGRWRLRSFEASDAVLRLERAADGRGNWSLAAPPDASGPRAEIDIGRIALRRLSIHYHDVRTGTRRFVDVDELYGGGGHDAALHLALRGRMDQGAAASLRLDAGPLRLLQDGAGPWPFTLEAKAAGARLRAGGTLDTRRGEARLRLDAGAEDPAPLARLAGLTLPSLGAASLRGKVVASRQAVEVADLQLRLGESELEGHLALAFGGERSRLSGALSAAMLDLRALRASADGQPAGDDFMTRPIRPWPALDIDLALNIERWLGLPVELHDTKLRLQADAQGLRMPISAALSRVPVAGHLALDTSAAAPALALQLGADDARLAELGHGWAQASGLEGTLGRVELRLGGRGDTPGALLRELELSLAVKGVQLRHPQAAVTLDTLQLEARRGERLRGRGRGSLQGQPATLSIRGGSLRDMLRGQPTPLALELALTQAQAQAQAQARLRVETLLPAPGRDTALRFELQARRAGELARWLGVAPESDLPLALRGQLRIADDAWQLAATTLQIGRSELQIDARRSRSAGRPLTTATLRGPLLDLPQLSTLRPAAGRSAGNGRRIDAALLGGAVELADADIELELQRVRLGRSELAELRLQARSRQGRLLPVSATGRLAGAPFTAQLELELRGEQPGASLELSTGDIDLGLLLRELDLAEDIDGRVGALQLRLQGRGNSLREWAAQTAFEARLSGGSLEVLGAAQRAVAEIRLHEAMLGAAPGEPVQLRLGGALGQTPLQIELRGGTLADIVDNPGRQPFAMAAHAAGTRLSLEGEVALPLGRDARLVLEIGGERLDTLNGLARVELPPWGPWSLRGPIRMTPTGYELQGLQLAVGRSRLGGSGQLDISGPRPQLALEVAATSIQLDDFPPPQRLVDPAPPGPGERPQAGLAGRPPRGYEQSGGATFAHESLRTTASRLAERTDTLLSARFLRRFDASIDVKAKEVLSGTDRLADGVLHLELHNGRLYLDPAVLNLPGGSLRLSMAYDLKGSELDFALAAYIERFDYGIIARRLRRADDLRGLFSLNLELAGTAPSLDSIMRKADGRVDFAAWPTDLRSGVFDLWSVNMLLALLPLIDPGSKAAVNCIVARFDLKDGVLRDDKILIDTTALRIRGAGQADLASEELAFVFRPRAKGFALFRLQTPLRVSGSLTGQRFGFTPLDLAESVLRLIASPILLPIERLTLGPLPRDGADVCTDPLRAGGG